METIIKNKHNKTVGTIGMNPHMFKYLFNVFLIIYDIFNRETVRPIHWSHFNFINH